MFTRTHIGERRFDWRAFRLQNKILLLFFTFNHQNVNSKCNNDAQVREAFVWISTLGKKQKRSISRPTAAREGESSRSSSQNPACFHLCYTVYRPSLAPRWRFCQMLFFLIIFLQSMRHTSSRTWNMHFCSNIYPVSTLKVKISENTKKTRFEPIIEWGLKRIGVRQCKWTLYKVSERAGERMEEVKRKKEGRGKDLPGHK